jgi:hypothetical protein
VSNKTCSCSENTSRSLRLRTSSTSTARAGRVRGGLYLRHRRCVLPQMAHDTDRRETGYNSSKIRFDRSGNGFVFAVSVFTNLSRRVSCL